MRVTFLGTAAAEGIPALWCACEYCTAARRERGRSLRRRSALLVDDRLLIDCGPDVVDSATFIGLDLSPVTTLLITHDHEDHLHLPSIAIRRDGFCATPLPTMDVYSSASGRRQILDEPHDEAALRIRTHEVSAFQSFVADGYRVDALRAHHGTAGMDPLFFAVQGGDGGPQLLYAHDTGPFPEEDWAYLERPPAGRRFSFDLVSLDCTFGISGHPPTGHMGVKEVLRHRDRLAASGLLGPDARVFANHFSHNGTPAYSELARLLEGTGVEPSYDGLTLDL